MALIRSNSLSLNTSAINNSFASQPQASTPQAPTSTGLFGATMNNATSSGPPFGVQSTATSGPSLFGASLNNQANKTTPSLFGASTTQPAASTGGLFGSTPAPPAATTGGLFGSAPAPAASGGLFGASSSQPAATGGLFGSSTAQPAATGGLFGASTAQPASGGLFGSTQAKSNPFGGSTTGGLFGSTQPKPAGGLFGSTQPAPNNNTAPNIQQQPSLLSASRYSLGQPAPFTGRLSMGQGNTTQAAATPATKLDWTNVKPVTRFPDLVDSAKEQLEFVDRLVKQQEDYAKQIEAFLPVHSNNMLSLQPDIDMIQDKCDQAESALVSDAQGIQQVKLLTQKDHQDIQRLERIGENQRLPTNYQYNPAAQQARKTASEPATDDEYDVNLIKNYFVPMANEMQMLLDAYTSNLSEIENHLGTIEATAVAQSHALNQQRAGGAAQDSVRQLADTLRGFESTILTTAAKVGAAREDVTNLSLKTANGY